MIVPASKTMLEPVVLDPEASACVPPLNRSVVPAEAVSVPDCVPEPDSVSVPESTLIVPALR